MSELRASYKSHAKINLDLRVFPLAGGFHPLHSWFRTIELHDSLTIEPAKGVGGFNLSCDDPAVPTDASNLIWQAWQRLGGEQRPSLSVHLDKRIPMGGGLGGGSSNAATMLHAARQSWPMIDGPTDGVAAALGSDVPFFFAGSPDATVAGRGERVAPFTAKRRHAVLLFLPGIHCATPAVFKRFDQLPPPDRDPAPDYEAWSKLPALELLPRLRNDLQSPCFDLHPPLADLHATAEAQLNRKVLLSGSGSSMFTLFDDVDEANDVASRWTQASVNVVVC